MISILVNQVFVLETISICRHPFCSRVVLHAINNATFEEIGQTRGSSAAPIQFSFRKRANFHSRFLCYQCVFDPVSLSTLSLFSCAFAFSSNLICWRPKEMYRRADEISVTVAAFIIFKGLISSVKRQQAILPIHCRRDFHAQEKNRAVRNIDS